MTQDEALSQKVMDALRELQSAHQSSDDPLRETLSRLTVTPHSDEAGDLEVIYVVYTNSQGNERIFDMRAKFVKRNSVTHIAEQIYRWASNL